MNARHNFYSSVFEVINSYKKKESEHESSGLFGRHLLSVGVFSAGLLVAVVTGFAFQYPKYMVFRMPEAISAPPVDVARVFDAQQSSAAENIIDTQLQLEPTKDTYVSVRDPRRSFGRLPQLIAQGPSQSSIYLQYSVPARTEISQAMLMLPINGALTGSAEVYALDNTLWEEYTTTYSTRPQGTTRYIGTITPDNSSYAVDVTHYISPDSDITFLLTAESGNFSLSSREETDASHPVLVIE
jgi:hypothetical protein